MTIFFCNKGTSDEKLKRYRDFERYEPSPETQAVINAKYKAMEVVELLLNLEFNTRLEVILIYVFINKLGDNVINKIIRIFVICNIPFALKLS